MSTNKTTVAIWRHLLLPLSETFIEQQARHLVDYKPIFVGRREINQDAFRLSDLMAICQDNSIRQRLQEAKYVVTRQSRLLQAGLMEARPEVIHAHFGMDAVYALWYKRWLGVPLVTTFHGIDVTRARQGTFQTLRPTWLVYHRYHHALQEHGDVFIAVSEFIRSRLIEQGFPQDRTVVHYIGVDTEQFEPLSATRNHSGSVRLLAINRLVEKKGMKYLIQAMSRILQVAPDVELHIVGDGPLRPTLERMAVHLGIDKKIRFLGALAHEAVRRELAQADIFVLPSVTAVDGDSEGLPISILEAMASELPVVSTWHSGIPEAVIDGKTGFLAQEKNPDQLAQSLLHLIQDPGLRGTMGREGRLVTEARFSVKRQTALLERIYDHAREECVSHGATRP